MTGDAKLLLTLIELDSLETAVINRDFLSTDQLLKAIKMARALRGAEYVSSEAVAEVICHTKADFDSGKIGVIRFTDQRLPEGTTLFAASKCESQPTKEG